MVSDFGITRYCNECGGEILFEGDMVTMYAGKKICPRERAEPHKCPHKTSEDEE